MLLLLSEDGESLWSPEAVERKLNLTPQSAKPHLDQLVSHGLLIAVNGPPDPLYRYSPSSYKLRRTVGQLCKAYATQRVAVLTLIFANPVDKIRLFTETFRMIKGESESKT